jgi:hypothetical protein
MTVNKSINTSSMASAIIVAASIWVALISSAAFSIPMSSLAVLKS